MANPAVITGARGPENRNPTEVAQGGAGLNAVPEGKRMFRFVKSAYQLQLTAGVVRKLPDGRETYEKPIKLKADEFFVTLDKVKDKDKIEMVEQHPDYGLDFFDFGEQLAKDAEARRNKALADLTSSDNLRNPETRRILLEALKATGEEDFQLPKPTGKVDQPKPDAK